MSSPASRTFDELPPIAGDVRPFRLGVGDDELKRRPRGFGLPPCLPRRGPRRWAPLCRAGAFLRRTARLPVGDQPPVGGLAAGNELVLSLGRGSASSGRVAPAARRPRLATRRPAPAAPRSAPPERRRGLRAPHRTGDGQAHRMVRGQGYVTCRNLNSHLLRGFYLIPPARHNPNHAARIAAEAVSLAR
jgi:hypothetical protein